MDPSFGARLRAHREQQQVALSAIASETKIKLSTLEGLEADDVSQWPGGIFRRAYVRAYARAVGLDPETLVREFLEVHPEPVVVALEGPQTELENPQWPAGFRRLVSSAIAAVPSRRQAVDDVPAAAIVNGETDRSAPAAVQVATSSPADVEETPVEPPRTDREEAAELNLLTAAELCTRLGRVLDRREVAPILQDAIAALDAVGLVVWSWDARTATLKPSLATGYSDAALARMPRVHAAADNAIARAFHAAHECIVEGGDETTGAVVVPLMAHTGCVGVLAIELRHGGEQQECVRAFAAILAAQLVTLVGAATLADAVNA